MKTIEITPEIINDITLNGGRLNIYLKPEHDNIARAGSEEYIENYLLSNIIIQNEKLAAFTQGDHMSSANLFFEGRRSYYSYTNTCDAFINFVPSHTSSSTPQCDTHMMSLSRYRDIEWITSNRYEKIYEGQGSIDDFDAIKKHIRGGSIFRISLEIDTNSWICTDVDLPFFVISGNYCRFQTKIHWYPKIFDHLHQTEKELHQKGFPMKQSDGSKGYGIDMLLPASCTYLSVYSDGTYDDHYSLMTGNRKKYKRIILFAG